MNKTEFVAWMAQRMETTKSEASRWVDGWWEGVSEALSNGGRLDFIGHGSFKVTSRQARTGRNPQTGEVIQIAASKSPTFKAGKRLKDSVQ